MEVLSNGADELIEALLMEGLGNGDGGIEAWELPVAELFVEGGVLQAQLVVDGLSRGRRSSGVVEVAVDGVPVDGEVEAQVAEEARPGVAVGWGGSLMRAVGDPSQV
jgi:hypothetical protein